MSCRNKYMDHIGKVEAFSETGPAILHLIIAFLRYNYFSVITHSPLQPAGGGVSLSKLQRSMYN